MLPEEKKIKLSDTFEISVDMIKLLLEMSNTKHINGTGEKTKQATLTLQQ